MLMFSFVSCAEEAVVPEEPTVPEKPEEPEKPASYTVTLDDGLGTVTVLKEQSILIKPLNPEGKDGVEFLEWLLDGRPVEKWNCELSSDITLKARWGVANLSDIPLLGEKNRRQH